MVYCSFQNAVQSNEAWRAMLLLSNGDFRRLLLFSSLPSLPDGGLQPTNPQRHGGRGLQSVGGVDVEAPATMEEYDYKCMYEVEYNKVRLGLEVATPKVCVHTSRYS